MGSLKFTFTFLSLHGAREICIRDYTHMVTHLCARYELADCKISEKFDLASVLNTVLCLRWSVFSNSSQGNCMIFIYTYFKMRNQWFMQEKIIITMKRENEKRNTLSQQVTRTANGMFCQCIGIRNVSVYAVVHFGTSSILLAHISHFQCYRIVGL